MVFSLYFLISFLILRINLFSTSLVRIIISLSKKISKTHIPRKLRNNDSYFINDVDADKDDTYTFDINFLKILKTKIINAFKYARKNNYKHINVFCASRSSQSFVIGQCIQKYDVCTFVWEFKNNSYVDSINIKEIE
ncbi:MAG: hypothetical protein LBC33_02790 [Mycoplasmataceae bacterium]|nr:hypothetical protein [Mycoplasmataceae bacterium]